ncbi:ankyrin repeat domain-containing protein SOWAHC-like [Pholidichthys leucotaenia]
MAVELSQESIVNFVRGRGFRVRNAELVEHFKDVFPEEPERRAAARDTFKKYVDNVAFVRAESGIKYVCLRKKFRAASRADSDPVKRAGAEPNRYIQAPEAADVGDAQVTPAGSGYGSDSQVRVPHNFTNENIPADTGAKGRESVCVVGRVDGSSGDMGNRASSKAKRRDSEKERAGKGLNIPEITVIGASPLPAEQPAFILPGPAHTGKTGRVDACAAGLDPAAAQMQVLSPQEAPRGSGAPVDGEGVLDARGLSGGEDDGSPSSTPKGSRRHFIEVMMSSSSQVRHSLASRGSVYLPSKSDSDSLSQVSSSLDDDQERSVALDPLEHQWMMCASDGKWGSLHPLLSTEPSLVLRKDFVTGFTCLHWAAKHGKPELMARIINFAKQHGVPVSVDVQTSCGYTPLHIAAMHSHMEVVKLLVGAYSADVEIRDHGGRKACQYLTDNASVDIRDIIGAYEVSLEAENADPRDRRHQKIPKVLQTNLKPLRLLNPNDCDSLDGDDRIREKPVRRKSSFSRMKPKLQRLRVRTSQIIQSVTFHDVEDSSSDSGSFKSRPKSHFFC